MQIVIHVDSHYDWEPVPPGTTVTEKDIAARRVKPAADGRWLMRVKRAVKTHTTVGLPEQQIIAYIIGEAVRSRAVLTRKEAVAQYIARHVLPHHAHRKWVERVEVADSGPEPELFDKLIAPHLENLQSAYLDDDSEDVDDVAALRTAYLEDAEPQDHADHVAAHLGAKAHHGASR